MLLQEIEESKRIAVLVLERHNINIADDAGISLIAEGLRIASDDVFFLVQAARDHVESQINRKSRIELLEQVIAVYQLERERGPQVQTRTGTLPSEAHFWIQASHGPELDRVLADIEALLETERFIYERDPPQALESNRPVTAKNAGAECVYVILRENGVTPWKACSIIAEMLLEAEIASGPQERVQRALYDKLRRLEVR